MIVFHTIPTPELKLFHFVRIIRVITVCIMHYEVLQTDSDNLVVRTCAMTIEHQPCAACSGSPHDDESSD